MSKPVIRSKGPRSRRIGSVTGAGAWLSSIGLSSGLHIAGLLVLPTLLGWGWWEWRKPKAGGIPEPVTLHWATAPSPPSEVDLPDPQVVETLVAEEFQEPDIDWPKPLPVLPIEESAAQAPPPERNLEGTLPSGVTPVPLTPIAKQPKVEPGKAPAETKLVEAAEPREEPKPEASEPKRPEEPGEPVQVDWSPTPWSEFCPEPPYSARFQRRKWQGTVLLLLKVEVDGSVQSVTVLESSGHQALDDAARETLATWRFQPGPPGSKPTEVRRKVEFRLP